MLGNLFGSPFLFSLVPARSGSDECGSPGSWLVHYVTGIMVQVVVQNVAGDNLVLEAGMDVNLSLNHEDGCIAFSLFCRYW